MTPEEHRAQRDLVMRSMLRAGTPEERTDEYRKRRVPPFPPALPVVPPAGWVSHRFVIPTVNERRPS